MKNHKELLQKSLDWHEIKWGKIGGTLSKGLFVKSDTLLIDILSQRLEEFEPVDSFETYDMQRGNELEPFAKEYLEQYTGIKFEASGWLQSEENELIGISPDGITEDETICCEIKCLGRKKHLEVLLTNEIPSDYVHQCLHYFTVNPKLEKLYFIAYRPEMGKNFIKELNRESVLDLGWTKKTEIEVIGKKGEPIKPKIITESDLKPISEWVKIAKESADLLLEQIKQKEEQLKF